MGKVIRFGVSFDPKLLDKFEKIIKNKGYRNRSEAIRDIIRNYVALENKELINGIIKLLYDHRIKPYLNKISAIQNEYHCLISSVSKIYIDNHNCLEVILIKGKKERIEKFIKKIKKSRGIKKVEFEIL